MVTVPCLRDHLKDYFFSSGFADRRRNALASWKIRLTRLRDGQAVAAHATIRNAVLKNQFLAWAECHKIFWLTQPSPADLTQFRSTWDNGESTT